MRREHREGTLCPPDGGKVGMRGLGLETWRGGRKMCLQTGQCVEGLVHPGKREPLVGGGQGDV